MSGEVREVLVSSSPGEAELVGTGILRALHRKGSNPRPRLNLLYLSSDILEPTLCFCLALSCGELWFGITLMGRARASRRITKPKMVGFIAFMDAVP